jgi:hypothetical protein
MGLRKRCRIVTIGTLEIDSFFELFSAFEEGKLLGADLHRFSGFRIPAGIIFICFNVEAAESPDFNPVVLRQCIRNFIEKEINDFGGFGFGKPVFVFQSAD